MLIVRATGSTPVAAASADELSSCGTPTAVPPPHMVQLRGNSHSDGLPQCSRNFCEDVAPPRNRHVRPSGEDVGFATTQAEEPSQSLADRPLPRPLVEGSSGVSMTALS